MTGAGVAGSIYRFAIGSYRFAIGRAPPVVLAEPFLQINTAADQNSR